VRRQLLARPFDLDKLEFTGQPAVIADAVRGGRAWSASANGLLAFRHLYAAPNQFTWVSRDGRSMSTPGDPGLLSAPRISPDQKTLAFSRQNEENDDIWTFDLTRNTSTRFTLEWDNTSPIWSSDGKSMVYASTVVAVCSGTAGTLFNSVLHFCVSERRLTALRLRASSGSRYWRVVGFKLPRAPVSEGRS
jgi:dipeptidyl aminopeptidase/acylaminoacyl peptidase